jgi:translocation and assembly module TamB
VTARRKKIVLTIAASLAGVCAVAVIGALLVMETQWFADTVRNKIVSTLEDSTGGRVEIGSLQVDAAHLTLRVRNLILHGTEPKSAQPLARISSLELRLKLLAGFKDMVDLAYLGVEEPRVNLVVNADGSTNIPQPKVKNAPNADSPLKTVVDLAVGEFRIEKGLIVYSRREDSFSMQGENLRTLLQSNGVKQSYRGYVKIDPLKVSYGTQPPLSVQVDLPLEMQKDEVSLSNASLTTTASRILLSASVAHLNAPRLALKMNAQLSAPELAATFGVPIDKSGPTILYADIDGGFDQRTKTIALPRMHIDLGKTTIDASGQGQAINFNGNVALAEISRLFKVSSPEIKGDLVLRGTANTDTVTGSVYSRELTVRDASTYLSNVSISAPFHANSHVISLDELKIRALGGNVTATVAVEELSKLTAKGDLHGFEIPAMASALTGHSIGYDGRVDGSITANADLKAKGTSGIALQARLNIKPGQKNVPLKGEISATYSGANGQTDLNRSYLSLPHSRLDASGLLGRDLKITLKSSNLNDFLPLAQASDAQPLKSLPVTLDSRGAANITASIRGELDRAQISANATMTNFEVRESHFDRFSVDAFASPSTLALRNGSLSSQGLSSAFDGSLGMVKWRPRGVSPVSANLTLNHGGMRALLSLAGTDDKTARGAVNAEVRIAGTYGNPLGGVSVHTSEGEAYGQPFQRVDARLSLSNQLARLEALDLSTAGGTLSATGSFHHPADSVTSGRAEIQISANSFELSTVNALQKSGQGVAGLVRLKANGSADIANQSEKTAVRFSNIDADVSAEALRIRGADAGGLTASARTVNGNVVYKIASNFAGSNINVQGRTALAAGYYTKANAVISNLSLNKVLDLANQNHVPISGTLSANAQLNGSVDSPDIAADLSLTKALVYQEPLDSLQATIHYNNRSLEIPSFNVSAPAGRLTFSGNYIHDADLYHGVLSLHVPDSEFQVAKIKHAQSFEPGLAGTLKLAADISAAISDKDNSPQILATSLSANVSGKGMRIENHSLGGLTLSARTDHSTVKFQLDSDLAQSEIHASGEAQLAPNYPTHGQLTFKNIRYENISPFIPSESAGPPLLNALAEGQASINGPLLDAKALSARLELSQLVVGTSPHFTPTGGPATRTMEFQNQGPMVVTLDRSVVRMDSLHIRGPQTAMDVSGSINLANNAAPLDVTVNATGDLGVLQNVSRSFYSSGTVAVNAMVRGTFADPLLNGKIELHNANINYADIPNGISNGNGLILLNGTTATLQNVTAESGGGKIAFSGFVGLSPTAVIYSVHARASKVRTRYAEASVTANANLALTGSSTHSLLAGLISVQRVAYSSSSDIGSLLYGASAPPASISEPSALLSTMRLDIHVVTASDVRVVTSYVEKLNLTGSLVVRGTAAQPGITGKIVLTDGQLAFFGNTYDVKTGSISFYDSTAIRPILDLSLETVAQGVDVILGVTGPLSDMKLSYRSDPPLTFDQIVQLLATNTTPFDATIASQQPPSPQQSTSQMGESAILGQAIANPLASRVQRVFGLSEFKIDPSIAGSNGQPSARVTLQQKIASNLTFTYITDVTQTNSEIVRVQLDLNARTSAVALRDYNGNVSVELFYKFQKR